MPFFSQDTDVFHGSRRAFNQIEIPTADSTLERHGGDQYGRGFYTAVNPENSAKAATYAEEYGKGGGVLLKGKLRQGEFSLLNLDAPIGDDLAESFKTRLAATNTGNEHLDGYYNHLSSSLSGDVKGSVLWSKMTSPSLLETHLKQASAETLDWEKVEDSLRQSRKKLVRGASGEVFDQRQIEGENLQRVKDAIKSLQMEEPLLRNYYNSVADGLGEGIKTADLLEKLGSAREARQFQNSQLPAIDRAKMTQIMDDHATKVLNEAGGHGLYRPSEDTAVFKGKMGLQAVPDLSINKLVGTGVSPVNNFTGGDLKVGQVLIAKVPAATSLHAPEIHAKGIHAKGGGAIGAVVLGGLVSGAALLNGASAASAAEAGASTLLDGAVPGASSGFQNLTQQQSTLDRGLNWADAATATVATGAAVVAAGAVASTPLTGPAGLATGATAGVIAAGAGAANLGVGVLKDIGYSTGLTHEPGVIHGAADLVKSYVEGIGHQINGDAQISTDIHNTGGKGSHVETNRARSTDPYRGARHYGALRQQQSNEASTPTGAMQTTAVPTESENSRRASFAALKTADLNEPTTQQVAEKTQRSPQSRMAAAMTPG